MNVELEYLFAYINCFAYFVFSSFIHVHLLICLNSILFINLFVKHTRIIIKELTSSGLITPRDCFWQSIHDMTCERGPLLKHLKMQFCIHTVAIYSQVFIALIFIAYKMLLQ